MSHSDVLKGQVQHNMFSQQKWRRKVESHFIVESFNNKSMLQIFLGAVPVLICPSAYNCKITHGNWNTDNQKIQSYTEWI